MYSLRERCDEFVSREACEWVWWWGSEDIFALEKFFRVALPLVSICMDDAWDDVWDGVVGGVGSSMWEGCAVVVLSHCWGGDDVGACASVSSPRDACIVPTLHNPSQKMIGRLLFNLKKFAKVGKIR